MKNTDPALLRSSRAATLSGLDHRVFLAGCRDGAIPVPLQRIGRFEYARRVDLLAWLFTPPHAALSPTGPDLSLFSNPPDNGDLF